MPTPRTGEKKSDYISRCVEQVIAEGKSPDQAVAICNSMWEDKMSAYDKYCQKKNIKPYNEKSE